MIGDQPPPRESPTRVIMRVVLIVVGSAITLYLIYRLRQPIGWLLTAAFIAVAVTPPVNRLAKHMPRGLAIALIYVVGLVMVPVGLGTLIVPPMVTQGAQLARNLPQYAQDVTDFVERNERLNELDAKYDLTGQLEKQARSVPNRVGDAAKLLTDIGLGIVSSIFAIFNVLILSIFMLLGGRRWVDGFVGMRPPDEAERLRRVLDKTARAISGYVQGALVIGFIAAIATLVVLSILGVPFAAPLAVIAGFMSLIPLVGATIAAVIIGLVTVVTDFPTATIVWAIWAVVYQQLENNIIQPQVQKRTVHVQPIVVLVAVLFGATLLGIGGAIVAIPIAASIQIVIVEWRDWRRSERARLTLGDGADGDGAGPDGADGDFGGGEPVAGGGGPEPEPQPA